MPNPSPEAEGPAQELCWLRGQGHPSAVASLVGSRDKAWSLRRGHKCVRARSHECHEHPGWSNEQLFDILFSSSSFNSWPQVFHATHQSNPALGIQLFIFSWVFPCLPSAPPRPSQTLKSLHNTPLRRAVLLPLFRRREWRHNEIQSKD